MRRLDVGLCCLLVACGHRPPVVHAPTGHTPLEVTRSAGIQLANLRRPLGDQVWMALTLDAGSRDADPPQVAALAAFVAVAGSGVEARVTPDTTELSITCSRGALRSCADRLAAALATRDVERDALAAASGELVDRRQRAAQSDARQADELALRALLGDNATPWGTPSSDDDADGDRVGRFFEAHYGRNRALLLVVGDVDDESAARAAQAFRDAPTSLDARVTRTGASTVNVARGTGRGSYVSAAMTLPSLDQAASVARTLTDPLLGEPGLTVHAFAVRGAGVALVSRAVEEPLADARSLVASLLTSAANLEPMGEESASPPSSGDGRREARALAASWSAGHEPRSRRPRVSVAVVAAEPPTLEALTRAYDAGVAQANVSAEGDDDDSSIDVQVRGAQLHAEREPGSTQVAVAISFLGGPREEPPALHGRSALLAHLMAERCGLSSGRLRERLRALDGRATPVVRPDRVGVVFVLPRARWREAVDLAARCTLRSPNPRTDVSGARTLLLTRRGPNAELAERAGRLLDPTHPGRVAPRGGGVALARLTAGELEAAHERLVTTSRLRAALVGDVPLHAALERLTRWLGGLPTGEPPAPLGPWPEATSDPQAEPGTRDGTPRLLLALRVPAGGTDADDAVRAFARAVGRRVAGDGIALEVSSGSSSPAGSWIAVEWSLDSALLDSLPAHIAAALRDAPAPAAPPTTDSIERRAWDRALPEPGAVDEAAVIAALRRATPLVQIRGVGISPSLERLAQ